MKSAYLDAFSGLSGDMLVGAILDCGAEFGALESALASIPIRGYRLSTRRKTLSGIAASKFDVEVLELGEVPDPVPGPISCAVTRWFR